MNENKTLVYMRFFFPSCIDLSPFAAAHATLHICDLRASKCRAKGVTASFQLAQKAGDVRKIDRVEYVGDSC